MTSDTLSDEELQRHFNRLAWQLALVCLGASAALFFIAAYWSRAVFGLDPQLLWRIPFTLGAAGATSYLAVVSLRTGRAVTNGSVIYRATRPVAFGWYISFLFLLSAVSLAATLAMIYFDLGGSSGT